MFVFLLISGLALLAIAFRSFPNPYIYKLGSLTILAASFLLLYLLTENVFIGVLGVLSWFFLPWLGIMTRIRKLKLPLEKKLIRRSPPSREIFPDLHELTEEIELEDFVFVGDTGWNWNDIRQFSRIFYHEEKKMQASISLVEEDTIAFSYLSVLSRTQNGETVTTWDFPFSYAMKSSPNTVFHRVPAASHSFKELKEAHKKMLQKRKVDLEELVDFNPEDLENQMQKEVRQLVDYNLKQGLIVLCNEHTFRYSWRGLFFLWGQSVKDMIKLG